MNQSLSTFISLAAIAAITLFAAYALGIVGGENITSVYHEDYHDFIYSGDLISGYFSGDGMMHFANNDYYRGHFAGGRFDGVGMFVFADGSVYTGDFAHGLPEGEGTYADESGRIIYQGSFSAGQICGQGQYFATEGWTYTGEFKQSLFDGEGSIMVGEEIIDGVWEKGVKSR